MAIRIYVLFLVWQYNGAKFTSNSLRFLFNSHSVHFLESMFFYFLFTFSSVHFPDGVSIHIQFTFTSLNEVNKQRWGF